MTNEKIIISGASGLIGNALIRSFSKDGIEVIKLVRRQPLDDSEHKWSPGEEDLEPEVLAGAKAVINLNGATISRLPWTKSYRQTLYRSRIEPTKTLATSLRKLGNSAPAFLSASAVGYYGSQPHRLLTENSSPGHTFLAQLSHIWEDTALKAGNKVNISLLRTAPILNRKAMLKPLIPLTKMGVSGPLGSGEQFWPWISLEDEVRAIRHIVDTQIAGPIILANPQACTANQIGAELADLLNRPFALPTPAWLLRLALGRNEADSLLLADAHVRPQVLIDSGFNFTTSNVRTVLAEETKEI